MNEIILSLVVMIIVFLSLAYLHGWKNLGEAVKETMWIVEMEKGGGKGREKFEDLLKKLNAPWYIKLLPPILDVGIKYFIKKNLKDVNRLNTAADQISRHAIENFSELVGDKKVKIIGKELNKNIEDKGRVGAFAEY